MLRFNSIVVAVALASNVSLVHAGAATGGATEVTQIANNVELIAQVSEQMKTVKTLVDTYLLDIKKYYELVQAGLALPEEALELTKRGIASELNAVRQYQSSLDRARLSANSLKRIMDQRSVEAKLKKTTFADYIEEERAKIQLGDTRARQRLDHETDVMRGVNEDFAEASAYASEISGTAGVHQSVALLNKQMNRTINQNARLLSMMAYQTGTKEAVQAADEAKGRESFLNYVTGVRQAVDSKKSKQLEEARAFRSK